MKNPSTLKDRIYELINMSNTSQKKKKKKKKKKKNLPKRPIYMAATSLPSQKCNQPNFSRDSQQISTD